MAENPKVNLALVNDIPDGSLEQGTIYMSPDVSGNFIKVAVTDSSTVTIFDGSSYATKQYVIDNEYVVATALTDLNSRVDNIDHFTEKMKGGTAGQLLVKDSSTDYDMSWRTVNIGSQIVYDSSNKVISLKDASGNVLGTPIDATDFIKDGMVSDVSVYDGNLVISFNTDAGKEDIAIPLTEMFDSSNYYTKSESDTKYVWDSSSPWEPGSGTGSAQLKGSGADASGNYSVAEGTDTIASGNHSHAEGRDASAIGDYSHAEGISTYATNTGEHAQGIRNISHDNTLFSIGNGVEDRSNALEIMKNGDAYLYGVAQFDGSTLADNRTLQYFLDITPLSNFEYDDIFGIVEKISGLLASHLVIDRFPNDIMETINSSYGSFSNYINKIIDDTDTGILYPGAYIEEDYIHENGSNRWEWTGETMTLNQNEYYIWQIVVDTDEYVLGLMPVNITLSDCVNNSMYSDLANRWSPFEYVMRNDNILNYSDLSDKFTLIYVKQYEYNIPRVDISGLNLLTSKLYLDRFEQEETATGYIYEHFDTINVFDYMNAYYSDYLNDFHSTECVYAGEDITLDNETYHLWYCENGGGSFEFYGAMKTSVTVEELVNNSKYVNPFSLYCPFEYVLSYDNMQVYEEGDELKHRRCLMAILPGE